MPKGNLKILFAAGGTGGHLFPAIAIAEEIKKLEPATEFLFVGTKGKIEARVVPERGFPFRTIWISGMARSLKPANLLIPAKVLVSIMQSFSLMKSFHPDVVVGTGGFVTGPVVFAATLLRIPTLLQEQNSYPGFTTRALAGRVNEIHVAFEETKGFLKSARIVKLSGNPTRDALGTVRRDEGAKFFQLDSRRKTLLVFGGSLGAASINAAVSGFVEDIAASGYQLIWQTGERDYARIKDRTSGLAGICVLKFIDRMENAYAASDFVVCRAGAITISELTRVGKAAVLVPYPHAAAGHQVMNARALVAAGAAKMVLDHELIPTLKDVVFDLFHDDRLREAMARKAQSLGKPDAATTIAEAVLHLATLRRERDGRGRESIQV